MFDVWVIDFVANEKRIWKSGLTWGKAKRLKRKMQRRDRFSVWIIVPLGFAL